jgi:hypothetical protein
MTNRIRRINHRVRHWVSYEPTGPRWMMWFLRSPAAAAAGQAHSRSEMIDKARGRLARSEGLPHDSFDIRLRPPSE